MLLLETLPRAGLQYSWRKKLCKESVKTADRETCFLARKLWRNVIFLVENNQAIMCLNAFLKLISEKAMFS